MLRADRPRFESSVEPTARLNSRDLLLAVAPPPHAHSFALSGWPSWLIPTFRSGAHRGSPSPREDER